MNSRIDDEITAVIEPQTMPEGAWSPHVGNELVSLLDKKCRGDDAMRARVQTSTLRILSNCANPDGPEAQGTGLIVGYVQSGKTLSYTALIAAAHDNDIPIVVVIAGMGVNLTEQTSKRLREDLDMEGSSRRPWLYLNNPTTDEVHDCRELLRAWKDRPGRAENKTLVITVMKHAKGEQGHLRNLIELLKHIPQELKTAALIIDDEADQASLNTLVRKNKISATYAAITDLRNEFPRHTLLQYTATPQANIFIPLVDHLSPDFHEPLEAGPDYVGGSVFFGDKLEDFTTVIPQAQTAEDWQEEDPPQTLVDALKTFFIGVAVGNIYHQKNDKEHAGESNRSMMIHPSRMKNPHRRYENWVKQVRKLWLSVLSGGPGPDYDEVVAQFQTSYEELKKTSSEILPSLEEIIDEFRESRFECGIKVINEKMIMTEREWSRYYGWILIGGVKLDRGFTVEGLTVTYMPRGPGVGNSDTIQQRGRFFGYKRKYLGLCHIWLEGDMRENYQNYVQAEVSMRELLEKNRAPGALKQIELVRKFQLDRSMHPCRSNILLDVPQHDQYGAKWIEQRYPIYNEVFSKANQDFIESYVQEHGLKKVRVTDESRPWIKDSKQTQDTHLHEIVEINSLQLFEGLLSNLAMGHPQDQTRWQTALALIEREMVGHGENEPSLIVWMRPHRRTNRSMDDRGYLGRLFQGSYPSDLSKPRVYLGDEEVRSGPLTLQVHTLTASEKSGKKPTNPSEPFISLALYLDARFKRDYVVQRLRRNN